MSSVCLARALRLNAQHGPLPAARCNCGRQHLRERAGGRSGTTQSRVPNGLGRHRSSGASGKALSAGATTVRSELRN